MTYASGSILKTIGRLPIFFHYGIVCKDKILHCSPPLGVHCDTMEEFMRGRRLVKIIPTGMSDDEVLDVIKQMRDTKFSWVGMNCESFVNGVRYCDFYSWQTRLWLLLAGYLAGKWYFRKKR